MMLCKEKVIRSSDRTPHLWVKGNLPPSRICCACCNEVVDYHTRPGLYGYRCCWCQRAAHNNCFPKILLFCDEHCDFGEYKHMIIPPTQLVVTTTTVANAPARSGRMRLTDIRTPPNLDDWRPLFVIANSKSGDSNSAEVVSMFRGILHPLQVIEMNSTGPRDALRLVAKISPNSCRILVAGGDGTVGWILNTIFEMNIQVICFVFFLFLNPIKNKFVTAHA